MYSKVYRLRNGAGFIGALESRPRGHFARWYAYRGGYGPVGYFRTLREARQAVRRSFA